MYPEALPKPDEIKDLTEEWDHYMAMVLDFARQMRAVKMTGKNVTTQ